MTAIATVDAGVEFNVRGECPNCGDPVVIAARIVTVLTRSIDDGGALKLKAKAPKQAHDCGAPQLTLTAELANGPADDDDIDNRLTYLQAELEASPGAIAAAQRELDTGPGIA